MAPERLLRGLLADIVTPTTAMCSTVDFQRSRLPVTGFTRQAERSPRQN